MGAVAQVSVLSRYAYVRILKAIGTKMGRPSSYNAKKHEAAILLAEDKLGDRRIAEELGISLSTLSLWKLKPELQELIRVKQVELDDAVSRFKYAKRRERVEALNEMAEDYLIIRDERARWYLENEPDIPGGKTGRLVRTERWVGQGRNAIQVIEHVVDKAADDAFRATLIQIAKERGEWSDKKEISGPGGSAMLAIVEIEVVKQMQPPSDDDDDI